MRRFSRLTIICSAAILFSSAGFARAASSMDILRNKALALLPQITTVSMNDSDVSNYGYAKVQHDATFRHAYEKLIASDRNNVILDSTLALGHSVESPIETVSVNGREILIDHVCRPHAVPMRMHSTHTIHALRSCSRSS